MARRAELQNKPSWADAPEWAQWLGQIESGNWEWYGGEESPSVHESGDCWLHKAGGKPSGVGGEVLGDWRDTLERRPVDLSEPAGGVKGRGADGAEEINAMAQRLLVALKSDPRSFDTGALAEMVELADAEIVKRDAKVCGGEGYLNNHWFERGELPPVGVECVAVAEGCSAEACKIIAYHKDTVAVQWSNFNDGGLDVLSMPGWAFRPISTERDKAIDEMKLHCPYHGSWDTVGRIYAEALYDAGYRKQNLPAN
ncbi:hypothetical protein NUK42_02260 [Aeromonas veronii]|uniref:hypothetical protein n=1 Tax=Aeromonas veronii TaxID=654 RepID=UPI00214E524E|nr:hypothetical protein [Aeromonas veronii]MCR3957572.1 hypothetical protein [Aeromonas veronii]